MFCHFDWMIVLVLRLVLPSIPLESRNNSSELNRSQMSSHIVDFGSHHVTNTARERERGGLKCMPSQNHDTIQFNIYLGI